MSTYVPGGDIQPGSFLSTEPSEKELARAAPWRGLTGRASAGPVPLQGISRTPTVTSAARTMLCGRTIRSPGCSFMIRPTVWTGRQPSPAVDSLACPAEARRSGASGCPSTRPERHRGARSGHSTRSPAGRSRHRVSRRLAMSEGANEVSDRVEWCRRWESNPHETCASRDFEGHPSRENTPGFASFLRHVSPSVGWRWAAMGADGPSRAQRRAQVERSFAANPRAL